MCSLPSCNEQRINLKKKKRRSEDITRTESKEAIIIIRKRIAYLEKYDSYAHIIETLKDVVEHLQLT